MAVTPITPSDLAVDGTAVVITAGTGTAINGANSMTVVYPKDKKLLLKIESSHANTAATIGVSDFGVAAGQGVYTLAVGNGVSKLFMVPPSSRLKLATNLISITWHADSTGFLTAFALD